MATDINYYLNQIVRATYGEEVRWAIHDAIALINQNAGSGGGSSIPDEALNNAFTHKNIYRGNYLGDSITDEQYAAIYNGTFDDMYIGDFWAISMGSTTRLLRIADMNYFPTESSNHLVLMNQYPAGTDTVASDSTKATTYFAGYPNSNSGSNLNALRNDLQDYFGDHLGTYTDSFDTAVTQYGVPMRQSFMGGRICDLPSEYMISGTESRSRLHDGNIQSTETSISDEYRGPSSNSQLAICRLYPKWATAGSVLTRTTSCLFTSAYFRTYNSNSGWDAAQNGQIFGVFIIV